MCLCCHFIFPSNTFLLCFAEVLVCDELEMGEGAGGNQSTGPLPQSVWEILLNCLIFCWGLQNSVLGKQQWITLEGTYSNESIKARRQQNKLKTSKKYTENSKYDEGNDTEKWETGRTLLLWIASWSEGPKLRSDLDMADVWVKGNKNAASRKAGEQSERGP